MVEILHNQFLARVILTFLFVVFLNYTVTAHSGRTASDGCHNQKSTGTRHCHNSNSNTSNHKLLSKKLFERKAYNFKSYKYPIATQSFYTGSYNCKLTVDHIVAIKDIHDSGGYKLNKHKKEILANDKTNHVPACSSINKSKGASKPAGFFLKSSDNKGLDYKFLKGQFSTSLISEE